MIALLKQKETSVSPIVKTYEPLFLSLKELALRLGVSHRVVENWITKRKNSTDPFPRHQSPIMTKSYYYILDEVKSWCLRNMPKCRDQKISKVNLQTKR